MRAEFGVHRFIRVICVYYYVAIKCLFKFGNEFRFNEITPRKKRKVFVD